MKNLLALIGLVAVAKKGMQWYCDYDTLKKERAERAADTQTPKAS